ncbi:hypothetical protein HG263_05260 [Pseudoalteromonas sp. JBTF-M23]|uniref:Uncharacterized protein n=1 Tax=Pseudoalteromonas caenipelagi TaxID=2726988 RepID=A0A849VAH6_9GAMM|nr:hypothetical protein [Pseudoalteromonas caenipelagi]NOU49945.1 hypothetical protein [Pseudoalteromonas caenipelagi]
MHTPTELLKVANVALGFFALSFTATIVASYPLAGHFALPSQVAFHICSIVTAGLFKLSYVIRCVCQYQLGMEVK